MDEVEVKRLLLELGYAPSKLRGQNFLCDTAALEEVLAFAAVPPGNSVVEVGPGLGALTRLLLARHPLVIAIEVDRGFASYLERALSPRGLRLHCADVLQCSLQELSGRYAADHLSLVSNVPYSISSDFIAWLIKQRTAIEAASLLLQREFAERLAAEPGTKAYGSLTVFCQQFLQLELGPVLAGTLFYPPTKVESRLIRLVPRAQPRVAVESQEGFESFVRGMFAQRRKTLANNLRRYRAELDAEAVTSTCALVGIDPSARAETLTIEQFARLYQAFLDTERRLGS